MARIIGGLAVSHTHYRLCGGSRETARSGMAREVTLREAFRGVIPFLLSDIVRVVLLVLFPSITLCLVRWLT